MHGNRKDSGYLVPLEIELDDAFINSVHCQDFDHRLMGLPKQGITDYLNKTNVCVRHLRT